MTLLYIGCYTSMSNGRGAGINAVRADPETGALTDLGVVAATDSPSFVIRHPDLPVVYAVSELAEGRVSAWSIGEDPTSALRPLGDQPSGGADPCHLAVHGGHLVTANYSGGSVALHPITADGSLGPVRVRRHTGSGPHERQSAPHPHMVRADGDQVLVVDLGTDRVYRYAIATTGAVQPAASGPAHTGSAAGASPAGAELVEHAEAVAVDAGTGPRHLAVSATGTWHLVGELTGTLLVGSPGEFRTAPASRQPGGYPAEVALSADGRRLYVSNRGPDTIAVFALDEPAPRLIAEVPTSGFWPRHFAIVGDLLVVANERSHNVVSLRLDADGVPRPTGEQVELGSPTCVLPIG